MNDRQVSLDTGEDVEEHFHTRDDGEHVASHTDHLRVLKEGAAAAGDRPAHAHYLHSNHVVGEDVDGIRGHGAALFPPLLDAKDQDGDEEREEEEDVGEGEDGEDGGTGRGQEAADGGGVMGGVEGRAEMRRKGDVWRGGVIVHFHTAGERHDKIICIKSKTTEMFHLLSWFHMFIIRFFTLKVHVLSTGITFFEI